MPARSSFASLKARWVFEAFTTVLVVVPALARNSCVFLQVIQPLRWYIHSIVFIGRSFLKSLGFDPISKGGARDVKTA